MTFFVRLKTSATGTPCQVDCGKVTPILNVIQMQTIATIFGTIKMKTMMTPLQRINRILNFYEKRGVNKESVNKVKYNILRLKYEKSYNFLRF